MLAYAIYASLRNKCSVCACVFVCVFMYEVKHHLKLETLQKSLLPQKCSILVLLSSVCLCGTAMTSVSGM